MESSTCDLWHLLLGHVSGLVLRHLALQAAQVLSQLQHLCMDMYKFRAERSSCLNSKQHKSVKKDDCGFARQLKEQKSYCW